MQTGEYRSLVRRLRELRSRFLPGLDPTGQYSDEDYDRVRALQLLAHAEVEGYLEEAGKSVVATCSTKYHIDGVARSTIVALVAFNDASADKAAADSLESIVRNRVTQYFHNVVNNHGLKEQHCYALLRPLGVTESHLPPGFGALMDSFGAARGRIAHTGVGAQTPPDPGDTNETLKRVAIALRSIDRMLVRLRDE